MTPTDESRRLDKWLWCARRFRTRTLAARFVAQASVRVTRDGATTRVDRPSFQLREGDVVSFVISETVRVFRVIGFAQRRGPPALASRLYEVGPVIPEQAANTAPPACKPPR